MRCTENFLMIPYWILNLAYVEELKLSHAEVVVLSYVLSFSETNKDCFQTRETMAKRLIISEKTIGKALNSLTDRRLLNKSERSRKGVNVNYSYRVNYEELNKYKPNQQSNFSPF